MTEILEVLQVSHLCPRISSYISTVSALSYYCRRKQSIDNPLILALIHDIYTCNVHLEVSEQKISVKYIIHEFFIKRNLLYRLDFMNHRLNAHSL